MNQTLAKIVKPVAKFFLAVEDLNDSEQEAIRWQTCQTCPKFKEGSGQCGVCGCFMDVKTKLKTNRDPELLKIVTTHCPLGKWGDLEIANMYRIEKGLEPLEAEKIDF